MEVTTIVTYPIPPFERRPLPNQKSSFPPNVTQDEIDAEVRRIKQQVDLSWKDACKVITRDQTVSFLEAEYLIPTTKSSVGRILSDLYLDESYSRSYLIDTVARRSLEIQKSGMGFNRFRREYKNLRRSHR